MTQTKPNQPPADAGENPAPDEDEVNEQVAALLGRAVQDTGDATETVRLDRLTSAEKRVLLALLHERIGHGQPSATLKEKGSRP